MKFLPVKELQLLTPNQLTAIADEIRKQYSMYDPGPGNPYWMRVATVDRVFRDGQVYGVHITPSDDGCVFVQTRGADRQRQSDDHPRYITVEEAVYIQHQLDLLAFGVAAHLYNDSEHQWVTVFATPKYSKYVLLVLLHYILVGSDDEIPKC